MTFCQSCGEASDASASFCGSCGTPIARRDRAATPTFASVNGGSVSSVAPGGSSAPGKGSAPDDNASAEFRRPVPQPAQGRAGTAPSARADERGGDLPVLPKSPAPETSWSAGPTATEGGGIATALRRNVVAVVVGLLLMLVATGAFAVSQRSVLANARAEVATLSNRLDSANGKATDLEGQLTNATNEVSDLNGKVADQNSQLSACERALGSALQMDKALNDKVTNVLYNESLSAFYNIIARYHRAGELWVTAANQCDPGGGYSFE